MGAASASKIIASADAMVGEKSSELTAYEAEQNKKEEAKAERKRLRKAAKMGDNAKAQERAKQKAATAAEKQKIKDAYAEIERRQIVEQVMEQFSKSLFVSPSEMETSYTLFEKSMIFKEKKAKGRRSMARLSQLVSTKKEEPEEEKLDEFGMPIEETEAEKAVREALASVAEPTRRITAEVFAGSLEMPGLGPFFEARLRNLYLFASLCASELGFGMARLPRKACNPNTPLPSNSSPACLPAHPHTPSQTANTHSLPRPSQRLFRVPERRFHRLLRGLVAPGEDQIGGAFERWQITLALYAFCVLLPNSDALAKFIFELYDDDRTGELTMEQLNELLEQSRLVDDKIYAQAAADNSKEAFRGAKGKGKKHQQQMRRVQRFSVAIKTKIIGEAKYRGPSRPAASCLEDYIKLQRTDVDGAYRGILAIHGVLCGGFIEFTPRERLQVLLRQGNSDNEAIWNVVDMYFALSGKQPLPDYCAKMGQRAVMVNSTFLANDPTPETKEKKPKK